MFGFESFGEAPFGDPGGGVAVAGFTISPSSTHALGTQTITATGTLTTWANGVNPFSIVAGGGFASLSNYVWTSATSVTFDLTISSLGGAVTIHDSNSGTDTSFFANAIAPGAPTAVVGTDQGNGTVSVGFSAPADNGGSAITGFTVTSSDGVHVATGASSPIIVGSHGSGSATFTVQATNAVGTGSASSPSSSVAISRTVAGTFYLDNAGSDANTGLSGNPWRTKAAFNAFTFYLGDQVILTTGQTFVGPLTLTQSGAAGAYICVGTGRLTPANAGTTRIARSSPATINAGDGNGINASDCQYVSFDNLIVSGSGVNATTGASTSTGVGVSCLSTQAATRLTGVRLTALEVTGCKDGIWLWTNDNTKVGYDGAQVWGCKIHQCQRTGVITLNYDNTGNPIWGAPKTIHQNIYVGYSQAYDIPGNNAAQCQGEGISMYNQTSGLVEYCVVHDLNVAGWNNPVGGSSGFTATQADSVTFQCCEAYGVKAPNNVDGVGFDCDGGATNCLTQYCYSHGNDGAGFYTGRVAANPTTGNVWRYNISANNMQNSGVALQGEFTKFTDASGGVTATLYNNTFYGANGDAFVINGDAGTIKLYNNIMISKAAAKCANGTPAALNGNLYYALGGGTVTVISYTSLAALRGAGFESGTGVFGSDPLLLSPTSGVGTGTLPTNPVAIVTYFDIPTGSPAKDAAIDLTAAPYNFTLGTDFHGNPPLSGAGYDMGAAEFTPPTAYVMTALAGPYAITGTNATLTYTPGGTPTNYTMTALAGSYVVTGISATFSSRRGHGYTGQIEALRKRHRQSELDLLLLMHTALRTFDD